MPDWRKCLLEANEEVKRLSHLLIWIFHNQFRDWTQRAVLSALWISEEFLKKSTPWVVRPWVCTQWEARDQEHSHEAETSSLHISVTSESWRKAELLISHFTPQKYRPDFSQLCRRMTHYTTKPTRSIFCCCSVINKGERHRRSGALVRVAVTPTQTVLYCSYQGRKRNWPLLSSLLQQQVCFLFLTYLVYKVIHLLSKSVELPCLWSSCRQEKASRHKNAEYVLPSEAGGIGWSWLEVKTQNQRKYIQQ